MKRRTQAKSEAHAKRIHLRYFFSLLLPFWNVSGLCANEQKKRTKTKCKGKGKAATEATFSRCLAFRRLLTTIGPIWKVASERKRNVLNYCQNILRRLQCRANRRNHASTTLVGNAVCYLFGSEYPVNS